MLRIAEAINGEDFVPFNEAIWVKHPRLGGSVAWHQDGFTHWDSPELDGDTHGFNFMASFMVVMRQTDYGYCRARILKEK